MLQIANDDSGVKTMKRDMLDSLEKRYGDAMQDKTYVCATILDPRFKDMLFNDKESAKSVLTDECHLVELDNSLSAQPAKKARSETESGGFWDFISQKHPQTSTTNHDSEINSYLAEPCIGPNCDPLEYWRCHQQQYPVLQIVAKKFLSMQCTSVPSERLFSTAGQVVSDRRARLQPSTTEKILFTQKNINLCM